MTEYPQPDHKAVLIASDNRDKASHLAECLKKLGYAVDHASSGPVALEAVRERKPQIIMLDRAWQGDISSSLPDRLKEAAGGESLVVWIGEPADFQSSITADYNAGADDFVRYPSADRELAARLATFTRHQEATRRLRATEERYRSLFERSLDAVYVHDLQGKFMDANSAALRLFGYSREDLPSLRFETLTLTNADLERANKSIQDLIDKGHQEEPDEYSLRKKDGTLIWVEIVGSLVLEQGRPVAVQGIARDITERKRAAIKLAESERRFRTIFENAAIGLAIVHPQTKQILQCNAALGEMFGYSTRELCRMTVAEVSHPEDHDRDLALGAEMYGGQRDRFIMEKRYRRRGGDWMWGKLTATVVRNEAGESQFVIGMVEDITARKRAQEALEQNARSLATLMSNLPGMAYRTRNDAEWTAEFVSEGALELTGYSAEAFLKEPNPKKLNDLVHPNDRDRVWTEVQNAIGDGRPFEIVYRLRTASGAEKWVWEKGRRIKEPGDPHEVIEGFLTDITDQKTLEQNFRRAQRMESIGTLAGGIAHDLNNLLLPVIMGLDMLEMNDPDPANRKVIDNIRTSAHRGSDLVKQILTFARGVDGTKASVDLNQLFNDIESIIRHTFPKNLEFDCHVAEGLPLIPADPTQIYQVILNLCLNARDAMPHGGHLTLAARQLQIDRQYAAMETTASPGPHVVIEVTDDGEGISQESMERIFEPFFTTKEQGKGTGLGLSTSLEIVRGHGGFVKAYSEPGSGSCFKVFLPAITETPSATPADLARKDSPRGRGETILLVDDEASILSITEQTLETWGYRVITAENGAEAIRLFTETAADIDLVFTDMMMPVMDGTALIRRLREINPGIPVIATSGMNARENAAQAEELGVSYFIPKPYSTHSMLQILNKTLNSPSRR